MPTDFNNCVEFYNYENKWNWSTLDSCLKVQWSDIKGKTVSNFLDNSVLVLPDCSSVQTFISRFLLDTLTFLQRDSNLSIFKMKILSILTCSCRLMSSPSNFETATWKHLDSSSLTVKCILTTKFCQATSKMNLKSHSSPLVPHLARVFASDLPTCAHLSFGSVFTLALEWSFQSINLMDIFSLSYLKTFYPLQS